METKLIFKCGCGQVTYLAETKDGLCYDIEKHGSGAPVDGCFNCHKPLGIETETVPDGDSANVKTDTEESGDDGITETQTNTENLKGLGRNQLKQIASELGLKVPVAISNKALIEMIENARKVDRS